MVDEVLLEGGLSYEGIEEMFATFGVFAGVGLSSAGFGHVVTPVFVEFVEDFKAFAEFEFFSFFGIVAWVVVVALFLRLLVEADAFHWELFKRGICLKLLLDGCAKIQCGDLEYFKRLAQLRSQYQGLSLLLSKLLAESLGTHKSIIEESLFKWVVYWETVKVFLFWWNLKCKIEALQVA